MTVNLLQAFQGPEDCIEMRGKTESFGDRTCAANVSAGGVQTGMVVPFGRSNLPTSGNLPHLAALSWPRLLSRK